MLVSDYVLLCIGVCVFCVFVEYVCVPPTAVFEGVTCACN